MPLIGHGCQLCYLSCDFSRLWLIVRLGWATTPIDERMHERLWRKLGDREGSAEAAVAINLAFDALCHWAQVASQRVARRQAQKAPPSLHDDLRSGRGRVAGALALARCACCGQSFGSCLRLATGSRECGVRASVLPLAERSDVAAENRLMSWEASLIDLRGAWNRVFGHILPFRLVSGVVALATQGFTSLFAERSPNILKCRSPGIGSQTVHQMRCVCVYVLLIDSRSATCRSFGAVLHIMSRNSVFGPWGVTNPCAVLGGALSLALGLRDLHVGGGPQRSCAPLDTRAEGQARRVMQLQRGRTGSLP